MRYRYTEKELYDVVLKSNSIAEVCRFLNIKQIGGNYITIKKNIKKFNINTTHFTGQLWSKGKKLGEKIPIEFYLTNKNFIHSHKLKQKLISAGLKKNQCERCNNEFWLNEQIPLELHHIDCDHNNNQLTNIQILCANCHALTHTEYRKKNIKETEKKPRGKYKIKERIKTDKPIIKKRIKTKLCPFCGKNIQTRSKYCETCWQIKERKVERPSYELLLKEIKETNYTVVGKKYGVSDNAVRKWLKKYEKDLDVSQ